MEYFWHYSVVLFVLITSVIISVYLIKIYLFHTYSGIRTPEELIQVGLPFIFIALLFYLLQRIRLRFKEFEIVVDNITFRKAIELTTRELNWMIEVQSDTYATARHSKLQSGSWGEKITILRDHNKIMINSICDPNAFRPSIISYGQNRKNIKVFLRNLQNCNSGNSF